MSVRACTRVHTYTHQSPGRWKEGSKKITKIQIKQIPSRNDVWQKNLREQGENIRRNTNDNCNDKDKDVNKKTMKIIMNISLCDLTSSKELTRHLSY